MDPQDHRFAPPDGVTCTVCEEPVAAARVRLLAWRQDLAIIEIDCPACRSTSLGFIMETAPSSGPSDVEVRPAGRRSGPVTAGDVLDMHDLLAGWRGGLLELLRDRSPGDRSPGDRSPADRSGRIGHGG